MLISLGSPFLWACADQEPEGPQKISVGVTYYNQTDTFLGELLDSFKEDLEALEQEDLSITVTIRDAAGSQRTGRSGRSLRDY